MEACIHNELDSISMRSDKMEQVKEFSVMVDRFYTVSDLAEMSYHRSFKAISDDRLPTVQSSLYGLALDQI